MAIIDPEGLFFGERLAACSDTAQLYWPRFFLASNGFARLELSYTSIISKIFGNFSKPPESSEVWAVFEEYSRNCLVILYEHEGVWWAQFHTSAKYLPRYAKARDKQSPPPSAELLEHHQREYVAWKSSNSIRNESFRKSEQNFGNFLMERRGIGIGIGIGIGDGIGEVKTKAPKVEYFVPPLWIDRGTWDAFVDMRKKIKKPMTDEAKERMVKKLADFEAKGHNANDLLNESIMNSWQGIWEPKGDKNGNGHNAKRRGAQDNEDAVRQNLRKFENPAEQAGSDSLGFERVGGRAG